MTNRLFAALPFAAAALSLLGTHVSYADAQAPSSSPAAVITLRAGDEADGDYGPYITYPEMLTKIAGWVKEHPDLVHISSLGKTLEGRDIPILRISASASDGPPEVLIISGIHPREQQPQIGVAHLIDEMLTGYGKDPAMTTLLRNRVIWIVPVFNVDGKIYDMKHGNGTTRGADWRKNRHPNDDGTFGVDLNRNWGVRWGGARAYDPSWSAATTTTSGNIYEGDSPLSEPEDRALAVFIESRAGHLHGFLDLHSPLRTINTPSYMTGPEYARYKTLLDGMRAAQQDPYPTTKIEANSEPAPGARGGDSGVTYTWIYYTQGVYALNLEFAPPKEAKTGVRARYAPPSEIETEYTRNIRGPLLSFIQATGDLPLPHKGSDALAAGPGKFSSSLTPGATVSWTPPAIKGDLSYAVLVSQSRDIVVASEYRNAPLKEGFTLQVDPKAQPGKPVPMTLYIWDKDRGVSAIPVTLTISASSN